MNRRYLHLLLAALIGFATYSNTAQSQDKVERKDRKAQDKLVILSGEIADESPAGISFKTGTKTEVIPPAEIMRVLYNKVPAPARLPFNSLFLVEEKEKDPAKVLKAFKEFEPSLAAAGIEPKRYVQYRIAMLTAQSAKSDVDQDQARALLAKYVADNPASWEYPLAARQLARMQIDKGDFADAGKTLDGLTKKEGVPADIKLEAANMYVDVLFQNNEFDKVKERIAAAKNAPGTTEIQKARFAVYEIGCEAQGEFKIDEIVKKLDDTINKTTDGAVKALAYNIMGDCYLKSKEKRKAMWAWLWVDVVYYQDPGEHLKAMNRLLKYFTDENELEKKQLYEEKIKRSR